MIIISAVILVILILGLVIKHDLDKRKAKLKKRRENQKPAYRVRVYVDDPDGGFHCETRDEHGNLVF